MPTKISSQAHHWDCHRIFHLDICPNIRPKIRPENPSKNPSRKSAQRIRPKNLSKKSVQISVSFCNCDCPDWLCQCQTSVEDVASSLNVFMGSMATLHDGCLQIYICSREGQIETQNKPKIPCPALSRKCQRDKFSSLNFVKGFQRFLGYNWLKNPQNLTEIGKKSAKIG